MKPYLNIWLKCVCNPQYSLSSPDRALKNLMLILQNFVRLCLSQTSWGSHK